MNGTKKKATNQIQSTLYKHTPQEATLQSKRNQVQLTAP